ncbi:hypothetical protein LHP98_19320, partial [Rhodobacter sp. Har01]|uniref:hypothetical protein n=1 Tax=Rhodobacter sp. Har01 TaxID=2883999 RepID=UPI001D05F095
AESGLQNVNIKVQNMHPSEMKNQALLAAAAAEQDGFPGMAEALRELADICANEARLLAEYQLRDFSMSCGTATSGRISKTSLAH